MKTKHFLLALTLYMTCIGGVYAQADVEGEILYEDFGLVVGNIPIFISVDPLGDFCETDSDIYGQFSCTNFDTQSGSTNTVFFRVPPQTNDLTDYVDGLSTFDLVVITQFLLDSITFDNYDMIAADAEDDQDVDEDDKDAIRDVILSVSTDFPAPSWRFLMDADKSSFEGATPVNAYNYLIDYGYSGEYSASNLSATQITNGNWDVRAIKIGDMDGSHPEIRAASFERSVVTNAIQVGEEVELVFRTDDFFNIQGYQMGFRIDPAYLEVLGIEKGDLPDFTLNNFGDQSKERGEFRTLWYDQTAKGISLENDAILFRLKVKALQPISNLRDVLQFDDTVFPMEFYANGRYTSGVVTRVELERQDKSFEKQEEVVVYPNPAFDIARIGFTLETVGEVNLMIHDLNGKLLKTYQSEFSSGYNEFVLDELNSLPIGVLLFTINTSQWHKKGKIINQ